MSAGGARDAVGSQLVGNYQLFAALIKESGRLDQIACPCCWSELCSGRAGLVGRKRSVSVRETDCSRPGSPDAVLYCGGAAARRSAANGSGLVMSGNECFRTALVERCAPPRPTLRCAPPQRRRVLEMLFYKFIYWLWFRLLIGDSAG